MTHTDIRPGPAPVESRRSNEDQGRGWISYLVWFLIGVVIIALIVMTLQSKGGSGLFYDNQKSHGWLVNAVFAPSSAGQKILVMFLAILLFVVVMGLILWIIDRPRIPKGVLLAGFLGPVVVALSVGLLWSGIRTIIASFQGANAAGDSAGWVGFDNYARVFTKANEHMLINTVLWIFLVPILATAFGLVYATLVDRTRGEALAKALIFLPTAISMVAASVIWKFVYLAPAPTGKEQVGLLNALVDVVGMSPQNWITKYPTGTFALIVVMIWIQAGFAMTILSAAIKAVPDDIVEAAKIDGATGPRLFFSVTLPTIRPTLVVVLTTVAIASLKTFDIVNVMGGNLPSNNILANAFYNQLAVQQPGRAGAFAVLIFIVVIPVIVFNVRQMRKADEIR
ncbi:carbohydrate ABC transporter permease [Nakamurella lactea]|uniref:carbohydrate ABC transporter permease n=1 Tax=Nakamurella lactea TaxID=459515 RepID=UPI00040F5CEE|nr:sugar ABC transporter permease [Nakamurella lactea]